MLITFGLLLVILPAVTGLGFGTIRALHFINLKSPYRFDFMEPVIGLVVLGVLVNLENFFFPVYRLFAYAVILLGWLLFIWRLRWAFSYLFKPLWIGLSVLWVGVVSTQAVLPFRNYDSGLYHLPSIRWLVDSAAPFGLANLHGRLGFNSSWFSVSAILAQVANPFESRYGALATEALVAVIGIAILAALYRVIHSKKNDFPSFFLILTSLVLFTPTVFEYLNSPTADEAVLWFALLLVYVSLRAFQAREPSAFMYEFWLSVLLALAAVTYKVSVLPLLLIPVVLLIVGYRRRLGVQDWKNLRPALVTTLVVVTPWMLRGVVLSGCLIYPSTLTCVPGVAWGVPLAQVEREANSIMAWAREPRYAILDQVQSNWNWLGDWFDDFIRSTDYLVPLGCIVLGIVVSLILWPKTRSRAEIKPIAVLVLIALGGMVYWFATAPNLRFGYTWFWILALLGLGLAFITLATIPKAVPPVRVMLALVFVGSAILLVSASLMYVGRTKIGFAEAMLMHPPLPVAELVVQKTYRGVPVNTVVGDDRCYWAQNCTADFNPAIVFGKLADGRLIIYPQ